MKFRYRYYTQPLVVGFLLLIVAAVSRKWWAYLYVLAGWELLLWMWNRFPAPPESGQ